MADRDVNPGQGFHATGRQLDLSDWSTEETYWRENWSSRPYASADRGFEYYQPGYRYGVEAARKYQGKKWYEVEAELRAKWGDFEHRGDSQWEHMKDAARDAWDRVTGR